MRAVMVSLLVLSLAPVSAVADETVQVKPVPLAAPVEQCIRDNAARVERAIPDLNTAVDFLASRVCAVPVAAEQERLAREVADRQTAKFKAACEARREAYKKAKPDADEPYLAEDCSTDMMDFAGGATFYYAGAEGFRPPAATALAAQLLLDLRLSHAKAVK